MLFRRRKTKNGNGNGSERRKRKRKRTRSKRRGTGRIQRDGQDRDQGPDVGHQSARKTIGMAGETSDHLGVDPSRRRALGRKSTTKPAMGTPVLMLREKRTVWIKMLKVTKRRRRIPPTANGKKKQRNMNAVVFIDSICLIAAILLRRSPSFRQN